MSGVRFVGTGVTRHVVLIGSLAFKFPRLTYGWRMFLCGLLANHSERTWGRSGLTGICPVVFALPGGWLVVQRRAELMTDEQWADFDARAFCERGEYLIPAEHKSDSFGWLNGEVVALDYGEVRL